MTKLYVLDRTHDSGPLVVTLTFPPHVTSKEARTWWHRNRTKPSLLLLEEVVETESPPPAPPEPEAPTATQAVRLDLSDTQLRALTADRFRPVVNSFALNIGRIEEEGLHLHTSSLERMALRLEDANSVKPRNADMARSVTMLVRKIRTLSAEIARYGRIPDNVLVEVED